MIASYKAFSLYTNAQDLLSAVIFALTSPRLFARDFAFIYIAVGPAYQWKWAQLLLLLWACSFMSSIVIVTNNFIFQYVQICKPSFAYIYTSPKWLLLLNAVNVAIVLNWAAVIYISCWPKQDFLELARPRILSHYGIDMTSMSYIGISLDTVSVAELILFVECLIITIAMGCIGVKCAISINRSLSENSMSSHTKKLHKQMFFLLLVEAACPTLFLHVPLAVSSFLLFTGATSTPTLSHIVGVLLSSYNICCPLMTLIFMRDYRRFFLGLFGLRKIAPSPATTHATEWKTSPSHQQPGAKGEL
ncbi:7TM chemoreceptor [Ancylostoma caninum]|uniref:7TM chemoreceptor n=1 Tax=Ancylostoma caninum TaxID=29170 RepID=A0A368GQL4_ANCCA|nr:7TM chemoreceptor [Ancylostoma caninum]